MTHLTTRRFRRPGSVAALLLTLAVLAVALPLLAVGRGAAQAPAEEQSWRAELAPFGGQDLGGDKLRGQLQLRFTGHELGLIGGTDADAFFDITYQLDLRDAGGNPLTENVTRTFAFFFGGQEGEDFVAEIGCDGLAFRVAQAALCAATGSLRVAAAIFADGFESGDLAAFVAALDAGRISVLVRTTLGDLSGVVIPSEFPVMAPENAFTDISASLGLGLTAFGWCGADQTTEALFARYPGLEAVFVLDAETRRFRSTNRNLPGGVRPDITLRYGMGVFVRTTAAFNIGMPPTLTSELPAGVTVGPNQLEIELAAGMHLLANCGPPTTNSQILDANPGLARMFTFDRGWTGIGGALPPSLWIEVVVPSTGAYLVTTDAPVTLTLRCAPVESPLCGIGVGSG